MLLDKDIVDMKTRWFIVSINKRKVNNLSMRYLREHITKINSPYIDRWKLGEYQFVGDQAALVRLVTLGSVNTLKVYEKCSVRLCWYNTCGECYLHALLFLLQWYSESALSVSFANSPLHLKDILWNVLWKRLYRCDTSEISVSLVVIFILKNLSKADKI